MMVRTQRLGAAAHTEEQEMEAPSMMESLC